MMTFLPTLGCSDDPIRRTWLMTGSWSSLPRWASAWKRHLQSGGTGCDSKTPAPRRRPCWSWGTSPDAACDVCVALTPWVRASDSARKTERISRSMTETVFSCAQNLIYMCILDIMCHFTDFWTVWNKTPPITLKDHRSSSCRVQFFLLERTILIFWCSTCWVVSWLTLGFCTGKSFTEERKPQSVLRLFIR